MAKIELARMMSVLLTKKQMQWIIMKANKSETSRASVIRQVITAEMERENGKR